ncbi:MAG: class II aldolase/adducin family protein [Candidatus Omnitrophica bacterium]|nr:class II aldolase/adducin family protein [Candidatus Omnitrophota bacterium]
MSLKKERQEIIYWAHLLNQKGFVSGRSGNISKRLAPHRILITSHNSFLGYLEEKEILLLDLKGKVLEGNLKPTSEKKLHLRIHKKFPDHKVIIHAHSPYTVTLFHYFKKLDKFCFEAKFYLGKIEVLTQSTPTVIEIEPVLKALEKNNIVVLKDHGVVSVGDNFKEAFSLIELLEEQAKINLMLRGRIFLWKDLM